MTGCQKLNFKLTFMAAVYECNLVFFVNFFYYRSVTAICICCYVPDPTLFSINNYILKRLLQVVSELYGVIN
jgi:hypothetical protein